MVWIHDMHVLWLRCELGGRREGVHGGESILGRGRHWGRSSLLSLECLEESGSKISLWKICQPGRVWKPTLLDQDLTDPRNGGRIGLSGRVKAISRRVAAVWPRGAYPWMPRGLWRLPATEGGPWGRPWRVPRTLLRSSALRRSAGKSASLLLLCLPRNLCNSNSHPRCC